MRANSPKYHAERGISRKDSDTGLAGVNWYKPYSKWFVRIAHDKKEISLGYHTDFFEACCTRKSAENKCGYHDYKTNTKPPSGVTWYPRDNKWVARIQHQKSQLHIGYFIDYFEACCARKSAENKYYN